MGRFVIIGGGECGRPGTIYETENIDQEIVKLTQKSKPRFLLIALGNNQPEMYYQLLGAIYRDKFNCITEQLTKEDLKTPQIVNRKIEKADIIYVGGGNSLRLLKCFRKHNIDRMLEKAYKRNVVLCGLSAGAICWCLYGNSDSRSEKNEYRQLIRVRALGFIKILLCPHFNSNANRSESLKNMMKRTYKIPAIALDDCAALEIIDEQFRVFSSKEEANAYKLYWKKGIYFQERIEKNVLMNISELYRR